MLSRLNLLHVLMYFLFALVVRCNTRPKVFSVMNYGAVADGIQDCSKAFLSAWQGACAWNGNATMWIPKGTYLVGPTTFDGKNCKSKIHFRVEGVVKAPLGPSNFGRAWIEFEYTNGLSITGNGTFDGEGASAWHNKRCGKNQFCPLPISLTFSFVNDSLVEGIHLVNSKSAHMQIFASNRITFNSITITAPENGPNTDGMHIAVSTFINVVNSNIATGDDCISIGPGVNNIYVANVLCGPGHGISIGSLGSDNNEQPVIGVYVKNCTFFNTQNGLRIKTWALPYQNLVKNVTFEHIEMDYVYNPIIIDQEYCPRGNCGSQISSNVQISDIHYKNVWGISKSKSAVSFICSRVKPCQNILLETINLQYNGTDGLVSSNCMNAEGVSVGQQSPPSCLH